MLMGLALNAAEVILVRQAIATTCFDWFIYLSYKLCQTLSTFNRGYT